MVRKQFSAKHREKGSSLDNGGGFALSPSVVIYLAAAFVLVSQAFVAISSRSSNGAVVASSVSNVLASFVNVNRQTTTIRSQETVEASRSASATAKAFYWNDRGCQEWPEHSAKTTNLPKVAPTGMAVTLARRLDRPDDTLDLLCSKLPTQIAYFFEPQGIDILILIELPGHNLSEVTDCLQLLPLNSAQGNITKTWTNLDGSTLVTHQYTSKSGKSKVYLADYEMPLPDYIQRNMKLLDEPMEGCKQSRDYIQGTRYYSDYFLNLKILQTYSYMVKMDLDIEFNATLPFNMLWDMQQKGAFFGHTGEFPEGLEPCGRGIQPCMDSFVQEFRNANWTDGGRWKGPCSKGVVPFDRAVDRYYTNFIVMKTSFFQSQPVRDFGHWMNEYNPGFFKYRWTDQLFFHLVMGLFLGPE
jgi:Glycolipid 2-alpha-mannosyltransferase